MNSQFKIIINSVVIRSLLFSYVKEINKRIIDQTKLRLFTWLELCEEPSQLLEYAYFDQFFSSLSVLEREEYENRYAILAYTSLMSKALGKCRYQDQDKWVYHIVDNYSEYIDELVLADRSFNRKSIEDACKAGDIETIRRLANAGEESYGGSIFIESNLVEAASNGHLETVKFLMENSEDRIDAYTAYGVAISNGYTDVVLYLYEHGAIKADLVEDSIGEMDVKCSDTKLIDHLFDTKYSDALGYVMYAAMKSGRIDLVKYLVKDKHLELDQQAIDIVGENGDLELLRFCYDNSSYRLSSDAYNHAVRVGNMKMLKYLHENCNDIQCSYKVVMEAFENSQFEALDYLTSNRQELMRKECLEYAIQYNHLPLVKKIINTFIEEGFSDWDDILSHPFDRYALGYGYIEMVRYLYSVYPAVLTILGISIIIQNGYIELKDLYNVFQSKSSGLSLSTRVAQACSFGQLEFLEYILETDTNHSELDWNLNLSMAVESGSVNMVKWIYETKKNLLSQQRTELVFKSSCIEENLPMVQYLLDNQPLLPYKIIHNIVNVGHRMDMVRCLADALRRIVESDPERKNLRCPTCQLSLEFARLLENSNFMAMHYLNELASSCNHDEAYFRENELMEKAVSNGNLAAVRFIDKYNLSMDNHSGMDYAAEFGHISIMKFLHSTGAQCSSDTFDTAAKNNHYEILKFLYENRTEGPVSSGLGNFNIDQEIIDFIEGHERKPFKQTKRNKKQKTNY
ncbi:hypothetical protein PPL_03361 [Heterostelium album PN500]|uniref:Ankyrin repeat protein n=1 Tax=Heterostelium pallidum (strain ATCC 26659 / Pp 5 / PN500) TaxID=670386 RepID=D3B4N6_HETP5|nr:hypothetical protein PPL_03361 [Heterostelium album PN500]EFA84284.1 hypothetical protein PPL_03361 [Heterostelium album PN500]|eukprot:XP_020436400.1 hypothetical protein PPL_03361 [Heterostelium album PN500]